MATSPSLPAGWYPDQRDAHLLRYWDGVAWTEHPTRLRRPPVAPRRLPVGGAGEHDGVADSGASPGCPGGDLVGDRAGSPLLLPGRLVFLWMRRGCRSRSSRSSPLPSR